MGDEMKQRLFIILCLVCSLTGSGFGQSSAGTIQGSVKDSQGAVLPDASIIITNLGTNRSVTIKTNGEGLFAQPALDPGPYKVDVQLANFRTVSQQLVLETAQVVNLEIVLPLGSTTETVEVTGATPIIDTTTSGVSDTVVGRQITDLPLNGRNFTELAALVPGVTRGQPGNQQSGTGNQAETFRYASSGGGALSVNGLRVQANNFLFDGIDNNESLVNTIVFFIPPDAIQEFRVDTNVAPAEYGRAGGGVVNATYKSGTNQWHGTAFYQLRNSAADASPNYFSPTTPAPLFHRNQFGVAGGGYIIKNKLFIFGDYQGVRQNLPLNDGPITVPTALERTGNFSELLSASTPIQLYYPGCGNGLATCAVPGNLFTGGLIPAGLSYLNAFPLPDITASDARCTLKGPNNVCIESNFQPHRVQTQRYNDFDGRLDYIFSSKDQAFGRYSYGQDLDITNSQLAALPAGFGSGVQFQHPRSVVIGETHLFGANIINELRVGYVRSFLGYQPPFGGSPLSADLGIPNANTSPLLGGGALIGNSGSQISYTGDYGDYFVPEDTYQIADNVSIVKGRHSFKFGVNLIKRQVDFFNPIAGKGFFQANANNPQSTGFEQSDLLVGWINNYQVGPASAMFHTRSWENGFYGQDDYRVSNRLTLNLGLRYDFFTWPTEENNRMANFNPVTGAIEVAGQNGISDTAGLVNPKKNFAPRVGFAYDLRGDQKTVIRGGYGIFYFIDREGIDKQMSQNAPFGGSASYTFSDAVTNNGYFAPGTGTYLTLGGLATMNADGSPNIASLTTAGFPSKTTLSGIDLAHPQNVSLTAWLTHDTTSSVQEWNVQVEQQLDSKTAFNLAYVGNRGNHLATFYDINRPAYATGINPYPGLGTVPVNDTEGTSTYNGLQTQIERRMMSGLQFHAAYTWSHAIDNSQPGFDTDYRYGGNPVDAFDWWTRERANSNLDVRNRFVFNALYDLPFGHGRSFGANWNGAVNAVLGGWEFAPIVTLASGFPFDVVCNYCSSPSTRPDLVGTLHQTNNPMQWFNVASFQKVPTANGVALFPGNSPRNPFTGAGTKTMDLAVSKNFPFGERVHGELRGEFFNLMNTPQFSPPDGNMNDGGQFGKVTSLRLDSQREIQLSLRVSF